MPATATVLTWAIGPAAPGAWVSIQPDQPPAA